MKEEIRNALVKVINNSIICLFINEMNWRDSAKKTHSNEVI